MSDLMQAETLGYDPGSPEGDTTAFTVQLILTSAIPDGDIATLHQICTERANQIHVWGHSPDADAGKPDTHLPKLARRYIDDATEYLSLGRTDVAIPKLLKAAAIILAAVAHIRMNRSVEP